MRCQYSITAIATIVILIACVGLDFSCSYVVLEMIPVTLLFLFFNVKVTSGALNGFIFFIQFIDTMLIDGNGFISTHKVLDTFTSIYLFTYRMFNLNFFTIDGLSFCLWEGANTLDIFAFKYVTMIYSIVLAVVTVLLKKFGKRKCLCFKNRNRSESSSSSVKSTMIHSFSVASFPGSPIFSRATLKRSESLGTRLAFLLSLSCAIPSVQW